MVNGRVAAPDPPATDDVAGFSSLAVALDEAFAYIEEILYDAARARRGHPTTNSSPAADTRPGGS